jgi:hypothetical protein
MVIEVVKLWKAQMANYLFGTINVRRSFNVGERAADVYLSMNRIFLVSALPYPTRIATEAKVIGIST